MKQTQGNNGSKCSKTEYLTVEIHQAITTPHVYLLWHDKEILAEIVEDDIIKILNKNELIDFYYCDKKKFKIPNIIQNISPKSNDLRLKSIFFL